MKHMLTFFILLALSLIRLEITAAQSETEVGVTITAEAMQNVNLTAFMDAVPPSWLAPPDASPRYRIELIPSKTDDGTCQYTVRDLNGKVVDDVSVVRERVDVQVTITDLGTQNQIADKTFIGLTSSGCPSSTQCWLDQGRATCANIRVMPDVAEYESWLTATMIGRPGLEISMHQDTVTVFREQDQAIRYASFDPGGDFVLTSSWEGFTSTIWNAATGEAVHQLEGQSVGYSPDGRFILGRGHDSEVTIWDALTGEEFFQFSFHGWLFDISYSPDGRFILGYVDTGAVVWDSSTGEEMFELRQGPGEQQQDFKSVSYSPDGRFILSRARNNDLIIWDASTGEELIRFSPGIASFGFNLRTATYSPDGRFIVTGIEDGTAWIWDASTGEEVHQLVGHTGAVLDTEYSPDGQFIVTASADQTARIWDASTGEEVRQLRGHTDGVIDAIYSPDGQFIVTASVDQTARIWDASTGEEVRQLREHTDGVIDAIYSPDGQFILTIGGEGIAILWDVSDLLG